MASTSKPAAPKKKKKAAKGGISGLHLLLIFAVAMALVFLIRHSFIFLLAGMLPSLVALIVDRSHGKQIFKTVTAMNLAGLLPYLWELWMQGNTAESVRNMVGQVQVWLIIYSAAGAGWAMIWFGPRAAQVWMEMVAMVQVARLEGLQKRLVEEWGPEVRK